jgi:acetolactate synthase-1/3 small subunit
MSNVTPISSQVTNSPHTSRNLHTISLLVRDAPGVLVRVAMVFSRRGYNIESLVVSPGARSGFSRMTVTCSGDPSISDRYETEIALIKIHCTGEQRRDVLEIAEHFNAKIVDYAAESVILRVYGSSEKLDAMIALFDEESIVELVRSGKLLMTRALEIT